MGRLIDIDVLFDYFGSDAIDETVRSNIEYFVREKGTVKAIPKDQYENRLKADMVAMLTEIKLEIEELQGKYSPYYDEASQHTCEIIQQRINALKENTDEV